MFRGNWGDLIIPLSATEFLVVYSNPNGPNNAPITSPYPLADTIVATDPSVGLWAGADVQLSAIHSEEEAYSGL
jgi:hypothetical protein